MKNILKLLGLCALVAVAASCSRSRAEQMKLAERLSIECDPEVLALVGDKIPVNLAVTYPDGYFHPKATLEVTPVLVYSDGNEQVGPTFTYQGEKVLDNYLQHRQQILAGSYAGIQTKNSSDDDDPDYDGNSWGNIWDAN